MRVKIVFALLLAVCCNCTGKRNNEIVCQVIDNDTLYICDASQISELKTMNLSDWISDFKIVRFENSDTALFNTWKVYVTEHHIGILQNAMSPFKLFNHDGRFICDIGSIGEGPGEYTMLYSAAIDEKRNMICLAPFKGKKLLKYDLKGNFMGSIDVGNMQKPQIRIENDGSISLIHLCMKGLTDFLYAHIDTNNNIVYTRPDKNRAVNPRDENGNFVGYNHEIWFYNNNANFSYMTTASDTLYNINIQNGEIKPRFSMINYVGDFSIYNEFPFCFIVNIGSFNHKTERPTSNMIVVDKYSKQAFYAKIMNDKVGGLPTFGLQHSNNGWYYEMYEPFELIEIINKYIKENRCSKPDKIILEELRNSIEENDNNIMFIGKLSNKV